MREMLRAEFLTQPAGVVFCWISGGPFGLFIKDEMPFTKDAFFYRTFAEGRGYVDDRRDPGDRFSIFEQADLVKLRDRITQDLDHALALFGPPDKNY